MLSCFRQLMLVGRKFHRAHVIISQYDVVCHGARHLL